MIPARLGARDAVAAGILCALACVLFWDSVFRGRVLFERDISQLYWGQVETFVGCVFRGSWPLWDPNTGFGQPLLANPGNQVLYPWTWLNLLIGPARFYTIFACSHLVLSGLGAYLYLRRLGLSRPSGLLSAILWMSSGPLLSLVSVWQHFAGAAWIPWVLLAADVALSQPDRFGAVQLGLVLSIQILAGSADMIAMTGLLLAGSTARHWLGVAGPLLWRRIGVGASAALLALGLTAVLLLPALDVARVSDRAALPKDIRSFWSLPPVGLLQTLVPVFPHRWPLTKDVRAELYDSREPFLSSLYLGLAALPLVLCSFAGRTRRLAVAFAAAGSVGALLSLGRFGILYDVSTTILPPLQSLRYPVKAMIVPAFAWALLAGLGLEAWRGAGERRRAAVLVWATSGLASGLVLTLSALAFLYPVGTAGGFLAASPHPVPDVLQPTAWALAGAALLCAAVVVVGVRSLRPGLGVWGLGLVLVLLTADVVLAHWRLSPTAPAEAFGSPPPVVGRLRADHATRIYAFDYLAKLLGKVYRRPDPQFPRADAPPTEPQALGAALAWQSYLAPPAAARWGLAGSFDSDLFGLQPRPVRNLSLYFRAVEETPAFVRLLRIGAVSHVLALHAEGLEELSPVATEASLFAGPIHVFRVGGTLSRAFAVSGVRVADGLRALQLLADPAFDPVREVILARGPAAPPRADFTALVEVEDWAADRVRLAASLSEPGYVVLVEAYDAGWRASVDGNETPLLRANFAFRAAFVPSGRHRVEFFYRPRTFYLGAAVSAATLVLALALVAPGRRRSRTRFSA
jgi:Bacterial membrane protein YfhO